MEEKNQTGEEGKKITELVILVEGVHEYTYRKEEEGDIINHSLFYSKNQEWSEHIRGERIIEIIDDGNGYKTSREIGNSLGHDELYELGILFRIIDGQSGLEFYQKLEI